MSVFQKFGKCVCTELFAGRMSLGLGLALVVATASTSHSGNGLNASALVDWEAHTPVPPSLVRALEPLLHICTRHLLNLNRMQHSIFRGHTQPSASLRTNMAKRFRLAFASPR